MMMDSDQDDAFPLDSDVAFELFTPSKSQVGTIAFEDLWPYYEIMILTMWLYYQ
jgi:hypothetical protein